MGEIHELFVVALFLVWFAGATPENSRGVKEFQVSFSSETQVNFEDALSEGALWLTQNPLCRKRGPIFRLLVVLRSWGGGNAW